MEVFFEEAGELFAYVDFVIDQQYGRTGFSHHSHSPGGSAKRATACNRGARSAGEFRT
jgi:hypothetical protein